MILLGLGANLSGAYGSPEQCLQSCPEMLASEGVYVVKSSNIWKSAPVPLSNQPWYRNAVCTVETALDPHELLSVLDNMEYCAGRMRSERNEARVLDLDILGYNNEIINDEDLCLPHSRMHERAFVLYPLKEIVPHWVHPSLNMPVDRMVDLMPEGQKIQRIDNTRLLCTNIDDYAMVRA